MIEIKNKVNKTQLFKELTEAGKKKFEFTCEPDEDLKVFLDGAEALFKLLRLPDVVKSFTCDLCYTETINKKDEYDNIYCDDCKEL